MVRKFMKLPNLYSKEVNQVIHHALKRFCPLQKSSFTAYSSYRTCNRERKLSMYRNRLHTTGACYNLDNSNTTFILWRTWQVSPTVVLGLFLLSIYRME
ncbi:hypothetical protein GDO81_006407 [Engystomops pustulosus]|uniref:Uncharacterized protein n=1 Tax=Engystomops pustulosus TaxID=76066 RepID=A0AAV7CZL7_ENGPU|nr:hypothetical protein GDO81_006407 [Engystomops pustulosus]